MVGRAPSATRGYSSNRQPQKSLSKTLGEAYPQYTWNLSYATAGAIVGLSVPKRSGGLAGETSSGEGLADGGGSEFLGDSYWSSIVYGEVHCDYVGGCRKCFVAVTRLGAQSPGGSRSGGGRGEV